MSLRGYKPALITTLHCPLEDIQQHQHHHSSHPLYPRHIHHQRLLIPNHHDVRHHNHHHHHHHGHSLRRPCPPRRRRRPSPLLRPSHRRLSPLQQHRPCPGYSRAQLLLPDHPHHPPRHSHVIHSSSLFIHTRQRRLPDPLRSPSLRRRGSFPKRLQLHLRRLHPGEVLPRSCFVVVKHHPGLQQSDHLRPHHPTHLPHRQPTARAEGTYRPDGFQRGAAREETCFFTRGSRGLAKGEVQDRQRLATAEQRARGELPARVCEFQHCQG